MKAVCFVLIAITTFTLCVSSKECSADIFYDFMYCLSSNSQCAQCIPCYNNAPLYIPAGEEESRPPSLSCRNSTICTVCTAKCATNFNGKDYYSKYVKKVDASTTECPLLKSFVAEMNNTKISNINNLTQYEFQCAIHHVISIKYALITSTNHYLNHTKDDTSNCTLDFSHALMASCDQRPFCHTALHPFIPLSCETKRGFTAVIGAFCVSTKTTTYASSAVWSANHASNSIQLSDSWILALIIVPWSILCICGLIAPIFCLVRHNGGCSMKCMQCKKITDSERKLNKQRRPSAERIHSDTISPNDGSKSTKIMRGRVVIQAVPHVHHHSHSQMKPSSLSSREITSHRGDIKAQNSANPHAYHPQNAHHQRMQHAVHKTANNRNAYHLYHAGGESATQRTINATKARTKSMPTPIMYPSAAAAANTTNAHHTNASSPDAMRVEFQRNKVESAVNPAIPVTNERHARSGSVIVQDMAINSSWPGYNADFQHPLSALNQSGVIQYEDGSTVLGATYDNGSSELHQSLMFRPNAAAANDIDQKQEYYNNYWNQYYGIPPQQTAAAAEATQQFHHNKGATHDFVNIAHDYPDFANPNDDVVNVTYDDSKIQMILQNEIQLEAEVGRGSSSKVFKARWRNQEVAAKRFAATFGVDAKKAKLYIEQYASKVSKETHENVIKMLAFGNKPFTILTEYMNKGSVKNYVRRTRPGSTSISILDRIEIAFQAAKGIQHLHKLEIIHSEINCQNLLLEILPPHINNNTTANDGSNHNKERIRVVVTDYGLQNILSGDELETYRSSLGPLKWMAPECIENSSSPTSYKSDIYAFGITMWEIITGQEPYPDVDPVDTAIHVLVKERRPQSYAFIPEKIQNLMKICWHKHPHKRPDADKVVSVLSQFVEAERKQNANRHNLL